MRRWPQVAEAGDGNTADQPAFADVDLEDDDDFSAGTGDERAKRFYLALDDEVERAPSIGPRTAERLLAARIATVRDLLVCDPREVSARVVSRYVTSERISAWKSQARLVCIVPWLRGTHAQLLVGAGFDTLEKLQLADASEVYAGILRFAATRDGQSVLRAGNPPDPERVRKWMAHVALAEPERARVGRGPADIRVVDGNIAEPSRRTGT
jgi:hypothetical protein